MLYATCTMYTAIYIYIYIYIGKLSLVAPMVLLIGTQLNTNVIMGRVKRAQLL